MDDLVIFIVGCGVFAITIASVFIYMIASDDPNESP